MIHRILLVAISIALSVLISASATSPGIYRNEEFGITLPVPSGVLLCPTPENEHDHGPVLLLGGTDRKNCGDSTAHRSIDVFASFNAMEDTKTLGKFLKDQCTGVFKGKCFPAPHQFGIQGMKSLAARVNHANGWIDIVVVTQAGKPNPDFDASVPSVNYDLSLHTTPKHLKDDSRIFRSVLETIRLAPSD